MKTIFFFLCGMFGFCALGQTDIIEMRSRNASLKKYAHARSSDGDHVSSNFGILYEPTIQTAVLDSVKCISDTKIVMYTSDCSSIAHPIYRSTESGIVYQDGYNYSGWQPGADTVENHPLFSHRHSLDSVKMVLDRDYYFRLPADSVKFIGFDNGQSTADPIHPVKHNRQKKNSIGWELMFLILTPVFFAFTMGRFLLPDFQSN